MQSRVQKTQPFPARSLVRTTHVQIVTRSVSESRVTSCPRLRFGLRCRALSPDTRGRAQSGKATTTAATLIGMAIICAAGAAAAEGLQPRDM
jgi:hypothetical protein